MDFNPHLRDEYRHLFRTAQVTQSRRALVDETVHSLVVHKDRYEHAGRPVGVPWWFVAVIHDLEGGRNFHTHLHNGDPLTHRTVHVPKNRPPGNPPFTFEESARDALTIEGFAHAEDWSISHALFRFERYNASATATPASPSTALTCGASASTTRAASSPPTGTSTPIWSASSAAPACCCG